MTAMQCDAMQWKSQTGCGRIRLLPLPCQNLLRVALKIVLCFCGGRNRDWAMCHVGEKYQHLSLCSEGFRSPKETLCALNYLKFSSLHVEVTEYLSSGILVLEQAELTGVWSVLDVMFRVSLCSWCHARILRPSRPVLATSLKNCLQSQELENC